MQYSVAFASILATAGAIAIPSKRQNSISVTPHDSYSSSIGVLGCKIATDRVAYWPSSPDCDNICVRVHHGGRYVNLLKIDQSGGAYDISYDAWNYLSTGDKAVDNPTMGGGIDATYEDMPMSACEHLLQTDDQKLAFSAANSMGFIGSCMAQPDSWVAKNFALYNIANPVCTLGADERCDIDLAVSNQPSCPHQLGIQTEMTSHAVENVDYGTGEVSKAIQ